MVQCLVLELLYGFEPYFLRVRKAFLRNVFIVTLVSVRESVTHPSALIQALFARATCFEQEC